MRAAIVSRWVEGPSGATTYILEHCRRLEQRGWSVDVFGERLDEDAIRAAGGAPQRLWAWPLGRFKRRFFAARVDRALARRGYDIVHGHGDNLEQDVLSLHNCVHATHEAMHGRALEEGSGVGALHEKILREGRFECLIANSRLMSEELSRRFGVPPGKIVVIYPGYDPSRFRPPSAEQREAARRELGVGPRDFLFGLVTSGDFRKRGVAQFLGALGRIKAPSVKAVVVGKEKRLDEYRRRAAEGGIGGLVRFLPPAPSVERILHALDAYVLPAHYEEFGMSVQEAMACGIAVITGPRVGAAELLRGEARDFIVEPAEEGALAEKMRALASDPALRARLGSLGRECARGNDWDSHFERVWGCYRLVLKTRRGSGGA